MLKSKIKKVTGLFNQEYSKWSLSLSSEESLELLISLYRRLSDAGLTDLPINVVDDDAFVDWWKNREGSKVIRRLNREGRLIKSRITLDLLREYKKKTPIAKKL